MNAPAAPTPPRPPMAVTRAMRQAAAHPSVRSVGAATLTDGGTMVEIAIQTEMPSVWRAAGASPFGVRSLEPVTVQFPAAYPLAAPLVELRADFDRSHPHINPGAADGPVRPCLVAGSVRELVQTRGFLGLVEQIVDWLDKALSLSLNDPAHGWEPVRRDGIDDLLAADAGALRSLASAQGGAQFSLQSYVYGPGDIYRTMLDAQAVPLATDAAKLLTRTEHEGFSSGIGLGIIAWSGRRGGGPIVADRYMPENVSTIGDLLERADAYGCREALTAKLSWAATRIDRRTASHAIPVSVVLLARRPYDVVGTGSPIEVCPYLIEARVGKDLIQPGSPVRVSALRDTLSIPVLRRASGTDPAAARPPWTLIGCGSVGSKIALHCGRAGLAPSTLVDKDWFEPHNYARHAGLPDGESEALFLRPKVDEVARQLAVLRQPCASRRVDVVAMTRDAAGRATLAPPGTVAVVDTTGSAVVREALAHAPRHGEARGIEACLMGAGTVGYLAVEGPGGNPSTSDLVVEAYHTIASEDDLARRVFGSEAEAIAIGQGCSAVTFAMPDARLSALSASLAGPVSRLVSGDMPAAGEIKIGRLDDDGIGQRWRALSSDAWIEVPCGDAAHRVARLHPRVHAAIEDDVARFAGVETGGVLIGRHSAIGGIFQVVDVLPAPPDSLRSPELFTLGVQGLKRAVAEIGLRSGGTLQAVGTWHNHLAPSGPSQVDIVSGAMLALQQLAPLLMLIRTPAGYTHLVAEAAGVS